MDTIHKGDVFTASNGELITITATISSSNAFPNHADFPISAVDQHGNSYRYTKDGVCRYYPVYGEWHLNKTEGHYDLAHKESGPTDNQVLAERATSPDMWEPEASDLHNIWSNLEFLGIYEDNERHDPIVGLATELLKDRVIPTHEE